MKVHYDSWLAKQLPEDAIAFTFGEHVFVKGGRIGQPELLHEAEHVIQFRRYGKLGFLIRYFWWSLRHGYRENPLEVQARAFARMRVAQCSFLENVAYLESLSSSP